jgi:hypothetical protein
MCLSDIDRMTWKSLLLKTTNKICIVGKSTIFWDITPCSALKVNGRFGTRLATCFHYGILRCLFDTGDGGCETSVDFQRTTRRYIPEDSTHHNHCCENPLILHFIVVVGVVVVVVIIVVVVWFMWLFTTLYQSLMSGHIWCNDMSTLA